MRWIAMALLVGGSAWAQPCPQYENPGGVSSSVGGLSTGTAPGATGQNSTVGGVGATGATCVPQPPLDNAYPTPGVPPTPVSPIVPNVPSYQSTTPPNAPPTGQIH